MKVANVNTYDRLGGAARSAFRLHRGLQGIGLDSQMFVESRRSRDPSVVGFEPPMSLGARVRRRVRYERIGRSFSRYLESRPEGYELFTDDRCRHGPDVLGQFPEADIVNLHWVSGILDYRAFLARVPHQVPVVWTLHDMNPFTGGCHYDMGCGKYTDSCGACPQLGANASADLSKEIWGRKRAAFAEVPRSRLRIVAPSRWLAGEAERGLFGDLFDISIIPYGLDLNDFAPGDQRAAREFLRIPPNAKVILFVADGLHNRRKGFRLLAEALSCISDSQIELHLICLGPGQLPAEVRVPTTRLGFVDHDPLLSMIYNAADVFVIPSIQDNLPNTVLEAMACGTPTVGFNVGGIPEMVEPGVTGDLASPFEVGDLAKRILGLLCNDARLASMSANCRARAEREYGLDKQAHRYANLYEEMLTSSPPRTGR